MFINIGIGIEIKIYRWKAASNCQ